MDSGVFYASMRHFVSIWLANTLWKTVAFLFMGDSHNIIFEREVFEEGETIQLSENRRTALKKIIGGSVVLLIGSLFDGKVAQASIERETGKDYIDTVEINCFGPEDPGRIAILYRDPDGSIVDWRWYTTPKQIPRSLGDGRYIAVWEDQGSPRVIITPNAPRFRRTREDIELQERAILPAERRRKLSN